MGVVEAHQCPMTTWPGAGLVCWTNRSGEATAREQIAVPVWLDEPCACLVVKRVNKNRTEQNNYNVSSPERPPPLEPAGSPRMMLDFGVQSQSSDTRPKTSCIGSLASTAGNLLRHRQDEELAEAAKRAIHVQDMGIARARISVPARCCSRHLHHCAERERR